MKLSEVLYYVLAMPYLMVILYLFVFKTDVLGSNRWLTTGVVTISILILKQIYGMARKNGNKDNN